jgi:hypothetical protein
MTSCFNPDLRLAPCTPVHSCVRCTLEAFRMHYCDHRRNAFEHIRLIRIHLLFSIPVSLFTSMNPVALLRTIENT